MIAFQIKKGIYKKLKEIVIRNFPYEASAILFRKNSMVFELRGKTRSPTGFGGLDNHRVQRMVEKYGRPTALFHSHPGGNKPSRRDVKHMQATMLLWNCAWLIMSRDYKIAGYTRALNDDPLFSYQEVEVLIDG